MTTTPGTTRRRLPEAALDQYPQLATEAASEPATEAATEVPGQRPHVPHVR